MCISKLFKLPKKNLIIIAGVILVFLLIIFWGSLFGSKKSSGGAKKLVLIIQNAEHPALNATRRGILELLQSNKDIKVTFQSAQDQDLLASQIAKKFVSANPLPAVMVGIGTMATQALIATRGNNLIPIVFSSVTDPMNFKSIKIPNSPDSMITGVSSYIDPSLHFDLFKKILPNLSTVGILYNPANLNSVILVEMMKKIAAVKNLQLMVATINNSEDVVQAMHTLMDHHVQAVFINNDNTALSAFKSIVNISTKNKIPVFCSNVDLLDEGALAVLGVNQYEIGKQTGGLIIRVLKGEKTNTMPVIFPRQTEVHVNFKKATELGIKVPDHIKVD